MHIDMHYYGTYALAKLAGIKEDTARIIGTSAQFVDHSAEDKIVIDSESGIVVAVEVTTRHSSVFAVMKTLATYLKDQVDQISIWVPFHFFPGGEGDNLSEKLVCQIDSVPAQAMFENHIKKAASRKDWGAHLIGIAAHVYADTFAHYGFSGLGSRRNCIKAGSIKLEGESLDSDSEKSLLGEIINLFKEGGENWKVNAAGHIAETGIKEHGSTIVGHAGVAKCPDWPYLTYEFEYEHPDKINERKIQSFQERDNLKTYLDGCEKLFNQFKKFLEVCSDHKDPDAKTYSFDDIKANIQSILEYHEDDEDKRSENWVEKAQDFWGINIPQYPGDDWMTEFDEADENADVALKTNAALFSMAAAYHKQNTLLEILPAHGIQIDTRQFRKALL